MTKDILLVEGKSDQLLFKYLLTRLPNLENIEISPPKPLGSSSDGVDGILESLPNLLKFKEFGGNLGIVLDADYLPTKGFAKRREKVVEIIAEFGYDVSKSSESQQWQGEIFPHDDLSPVGLWIMPDHQSDGMFEGLLLNTIHEGVRSQLLERINDEITSISTSEQFNEIRFKDVHKDKTLLNTWLYWQKQPPACKSDDISIIECALNQQWLNPDHDNIKALTTWLTRVFQ
jgi:hypothetical protein